MKKTILLNIVKGAIIASFFTPLIVSTNFIFPYVFPKTAAFQTVVEIMVLAWIFLMLENPEYRPSRSKVFWALSLFLFIAFIASLLGVNFELSFWSSYERMTGLITILHYFALFLVVSSVLKTKRDWLLIFDAFIAAGIILAFLGFFQKMGVKSFAFANLGRASATFGNPAYFAAYILFILFFITFMFFQRRSKGARIYYTLAFLFNFLIFYWTQTRGALLAFSASLIIFLAFMLFWPKEEGEEPLITKFRTNFKKLSAIILIGFILFISLIYIFKDSALVKSSGTLLRLTTISAKEVTSQTRLLAWKLSWAGFKERPVLGWGWENYNVVFNKFYDPNLYPVENWFDRAHNIVFDTLISVGILGFISFFGIFIVVISVFYRAYKRKRIDFLNATLFSVLPLGYLAQDFFVFDMLFSYLPLFVFLAFVAWIEKGNADLVVQSRLPKKVLKPSIFLSAILAIFFIFLVYSINLKPALAGYRGIQALVNQQAGFALLQENFKKAIDTGTFGRFEVRLQLFEITRNILSAYNQRSDKKDIEELAKFALEQGDKTIKERPLDARYQLVIGQMNVAASSIYPERLARANEIFKAVLALSPNRQIALYAIGEAKIMSGKIQEGIADFEKAIALNDKIFEPHWNLAYIFFSLGEIEKGEAKLAEIRQKFGENVLSSDHYKRIGSNLNANKKYDLAIIYVLKAIEIEKNSAIKATYYGALADVYGAKGDKEKAREAALEAVKYDPSLKEKVDNFIKVLDGQ